MCRGVRKNGDNQWSEEFYDLGYGYKEWGKMECCRNPIVCVLSFVIVSIGNTLLFVDVGKVGRTMLKPRASLYGLFYLYVLELILSPLKLCWHYKSF